MAKFYYSYEDDLRDRNAPLVIVRWRSGDTLQLLVEAEPVATKLRTLSAIVFDRKNFIGGD